MADCPISTSNKAVGGVAEFILVVVVVVVVVVGAEELVVVASAAPLFMVRSWDCWAAMGRISEFFEDGSTHCHNGTKKLLVVVERDSLIRSHRHGSGGKRGRCGSMVRTVLDVSSRKH